MPKKPCWSRSHYDEVVDGTRTKMVCRHIVVDAEGNAKRCAQELAKNNNANLKGHIQRDHKEFYEKEFPQTPSQIRIDQQLKNPLLAAGITLHDDLWAILACLTNTPARMFDHIVFRYLVPSDIKSA